MHLLSVIHGCSKSQRLRNKYREEFQKRDQITEEAIEQFIEKYLGEVKDGTWQSGGWQEYVPGYSSTKVALNAYTSVLAREVGENVCVNSFNPGYTKTNLTSFRGTNTLAEAAMTGVWLALHPAGGPHGQYFEEQNRGVADW